MKSVRFAVSALALSFCATAGARTIVYDSWTPMVNKFSGITAVLDPSLLPYGALPSAVTSLVLDPGASVSQYTVYTNTNMPSAPKGDMFVWNATGALQQPGNQPQPNDQQFILTLSSATSFQLAFNDDAETCGGDTASFTLNGLTYQTANPCRGGMAVGEDNCLNVNCHGYNDSLFKFAVVGGTVELESALPRSWTVGAASAPEIDLDSASGALTLLAGGAVILVSTRRKRAPAR
jgi:hypothetical protein